MTARLPFAVAALAASLAACAHGTTPARSPTMNAIPAQPAAEETRLPLPGGDEVALQTQWHYDANARALLLNYRVRNVGRHALAVFDRGVYGDRAGVAFVPGPVGAPRTERDGDDLSLIHSPDAAPAAHDPLAHAPLVLELKPGAEVSDQIVHRLGDGAAPRRVRWCVAVMPLDPAHFGNAQKTAQGVVWTGKGDTSARTLLCSPWHEIGAAGG